MKHSVPLSMICNSSLGDGQVPLEWRTANVTPLCTMLVVVGLTGEDE